MTNAELLDLLRMARKVADAVVTDARSIAFAQWSPEQHEAEAVRDRIDAALAEHATAKPSLADIKWEEKDSNRHGVSPYEAEYSEDVFLTVEKHWLCGQWLFRVEYVAYAASKDEAKAKAVEYAGRLP